MAFCPQAANLAKVGSDANANSANPIPSPRFRLWVKNHTTAVQLAKFDLLLHLLTIVRIWMAITSSSQQIQSDTCFQSAEKGTGGHFQIEYYQRVKTLGVLAFIFLCIVSSHVVLVVFKPFKHGVTLSNHSERSRRRISIFSRSLAWVQLALNCDISPGASDRHFEGPSVLIIGLDWSLTIV